jgi:hypothetical protein
MTPEEVTVGGLVVGPDALAHMSGHELEALCGALGVRWMHPAEALKMCRACAAVAFSWN